MEERETGLFPEFEGHHTPSDILFIWFNIVIVFDRFLSSSRHNFQTKMWSKRVRDYAIANSILEKYFGVQILISYFECLFHFMFKIKWEKKCSMLKIERNLPHSQPANLKRMRTFKFLVFMCYIKNLFKKIMKPLSRNDNIFQSMTIFFNQSFKSCYD